MRDNGQSATPARPSPEAGEAATPDSGLPREDVPEEVVPVPAP
jgi:hypothetical protein